ncbi:MAG: hypothetical protein WBF08_09065 [Candidatus Bathyarchaeia archaeon]
MERRIASRLRIGSTSTPARLSSATTVPEICSLMISVCLSKSRFGTAKLLKMLIGCPASEPGVKILKSTDSFKRRIRFDSISQSFNPLRQSLEI